MKEPWRTLLPATVAGILMMTVGWSAAFLYMIGKCP